MGAWQPLGSTGSIFRQRRWHKHFPSRMGPVGECLRRGGSSEGDIGNMEWKGEVAGLSAMEIRVPNKGQTVPSMVNHADCPDGAVRDFDTIIDKMAAKL